MFRHDNPHTARSPYTGPSASALRWSYATGNAVISSSAIGADGAIYLGSTDGKLYAMNPDGTLRWSYTTGSQVYSSPAIGADGTVYVGSYDNKLYAINPNGTLRWSYATEREVYSSPAVGVDGVIYVGSYDGKLYAINPDGTPRWSYATGDAVTSSPAIGADGVIYVSSYDSKLYAIEGPASIPTATLISVPTPTPSPTASPTATRTPTPTPVPTTPTTTPVSVPVSPAHAYAYNDLAQSAITAVIGKVSYVMPESQTTEKPDNGYALVIRDWDVEVVGYIFGAQPLTNIQVRNFNGNRYQDGFFHGFFLPQLSPGSTVLLLLDKWDLSIAPLKPNQFTVVGAHAFNFGAGSGSPVYGGEALTGHFQIEGGMARVSKAISPPWFGPWEPLDQIIAAITSPVPIPQPPTPTRSPTPTPTARPLSPPRPGPGDVPLSLLPTTSSVAVGQTFAVTINCTDAAGQPVAGVYAFVDFEPTKLEVVDSDPSITGI